MTIATWLVVVIWIVPIIFTAGGGWFLVRNLTKRVDKHDERLDEHEKHFGRHDIFLTEISTDLKHIINQLEKQDAKIEKISEKLDLKQDKSACPT